MRFLLALVLALGGCSFVGIHDSHVPDARPVPPVRCLTVLPVADAVAAATALGAGGYRYAVETRTSPFPLAMGVVGAWATASAIYGFTEDARCRSALAAPASQPAPQPAPGPAR